MTDKWVSEMKPNCSTCTIKRCPIFAYDWGKPTDSSVHSQQRLAIEKVGCLSHPGSREYLNAGVISYLEQYLITETFGGYSETDVAYSRLAREAISLLKGGK